MNSIHEFIAFVEKQRKKANHAYMLAENAREKNFYYIQEMVFNDLIQKLKVYRGVDDGTKIRDYSDDTVL